MTNADHLHQETKVLPLRQHGQMLTKQFLASCALPNHPGQKHMDNPPPPRNLKKSLYEYKPEISALYESGLLRKQVIEKIHSETVRKCIQNYDQNKVLNTSPPPINSDELNLTRKERVELARLRSGYSRLVNSYLHKLDEQVEDKCPSCATSPHDVNHLFECRDNPTDLTIDSLWSNPRAVSNFLNLKDENDDET